MAHKRLLGGIVSRTGWPGRLARMLLVLGVLLPSAPAAAQQPPAPGSGQGTPPAAAAGTSGDQQASVAPSAPAAATAERFFGAVQAIYNPQRAAEAGVQWERLIFPWSLIQKEGPTAWDPGYFTDAQVQQEAARGVDVVGVALYTPQWATSTPNNAKPTNIPANLNLPFDDPKNYWGQFMYKLADHYKGQINTWVIWNEPDMYTDALRYTWDGGVESLYQLVKVAYQAVKKANPNARVALPGMTYWWDQRNGRPLYLARYLQVASQDPTAQANGFYFDIATLHAYGNPLNDYAAVQVYRRAMASFGVSKPIWIGESNIPPYDDPTAPISPTPYHATLQQQAAYIIQAFALARAAGVERMSIYKLVDEQPEGPGELYGLVHNDGSPRPAFQAYQTAVRYLSNPTSAVYTWDGSSDPPTDAQVTQLLQSNANHPEWPWPAAVNRVTLERGPERVSVVWNSSPKLVTAHWPAVAKSAAVFDKFGKDTGEVVAKDGQYSLDLPPASNTTDPHDPSLQLVGGDPQILVEKVTPLPTEIDAPIQVVWPRDGAAIADASNANVSAVLLLPGTNPPPAATPTPAPTPVGGDGSAVEVPPPPPPSYQPAPCRWNPTVRLMASVDGGPAKVIGLGARRLANENGLTYPVWDFNNVDVSPARDGKTVELWIDVDGVATHATRWVYAKDVGQPPSWQQRPTASCS